MKIMENKDIISIYADINKWENGELGNSEKYAKASNFTVSDLQKSIELQAISLRINKDLLSDLKDLAKFHGIGYQPLMKQILRRFVDAEKRRLANELIAQVNNANSTECELVDEEALRKLG